MCKLMAGLLHTVFGEGETGDKTVVFKDETKSDTTFTGDMSDRTRLVVVDDLNKEKSFESAVKVAVRETSGNKMLNVKFQKTKSALMQHKTLFTFQEDRLCKMSEATTSEKRRLFQFSATKVDPELSSQCTHIIRERTFMAMMALLAQKCATSEEYLCPTTGRFDMDIHVIN
eukprot:scpid108620/ scgid3271/ 